MSSAGSLPHERSHRLDDRKYLLALRLIGNCVPKGAESQSKVAAGGLGPLNKRRTWALPGVSGQRHCAALGAMSCRRNPDDCTLASRLGTQQLTWMPTKAKPVSTSAQRPPQSKAASLVVSSGYPVRRFRTMIADLECHTMSFRRRRCIRLDLKSWALVP